MHHFDVDRKTGVVLEATSLRDEITSIFPHREATNLIGLS